MNDTMNKEQFINSKRYVNLHFDFDDYMFAMEDWGFVYDGSCYIEDTLTWEKDQQMTHRWYLILENHQYNSDCLSDLEDILWDWAKGAVYGLVEESI